MGKGLSETFEKFFEIGQTGPQQGKIQNRSCGDCPKNGTTARTPTEQRTKRTLFFLQTHEQGETKPFYFPLYKGRATGQQWLGTCSAEH